MKYLGIDYGTKRIGLSTSDEGGTLAFPHSTVSAGPGALTQVDLVAKKEGVEKIVVGESRNYAGERNVVMEDIEQFVSDLHELTGLPVEYESEFMSSSLAARQFAPDGSRKQAPTHKDLDASAAAIILQSYLDKHRS